ncbi:NAD-dependent epimerase/dehydratase family protein [Serinibacter salmoneus]|uniref:Nucleoside-diphosphate-sugar epimerase n=1 Tax=Serinibacter salmoneus TaxID=556530 RepID=A0A2A9D2V1_9MICO|nr:NAD-dependent epimerase/dehydratase family protein [Serinibacter salmoneus]PFG20282.1 nucleoside-diphosphate-sugar epimerase [Serinibacter salmoneus]
MSRTVVLGYGPVGSTVTDQLLAAGEAVRVVTRSGSGPAGAERVRADLMDAEATARAIGDAPRIVLAVHAPYRAAAWARTLPVMEASVLTHAARTGATVVTAESLYAFDGGPSPVTESSRPQPASRKGAVRRDLLAQRAASGARVRSLVCGDFYGPRVHSSHAGDFLVKPILQGKPVRAVVPIDQPHAFTHMSDLARALVAASEVDGEGHELLITPNAGPISLRDLGRVTAQAAGLGEPRFAPVPAPVLRALAPFVPIVREIRDVAHQFAQPFVVSGQASEHRLGLTATPWQAAAAETVAWWREADAHATQPAAG